MEEAFYSHEFSDACFFRIMYVNYYSIYRKFIMFQSFITSLDNNESNIKSKR